MTESDPPGQGRYLAFYGLAERPFSITPDPRYLYLSDRHAEALAHLVYGLEEAGGFIQLTGEVGTGKTMVIRALLARAPQDVEIALIFNPRMSAAEFLLTICEELGIMVHDSASNSVKDLIDILNDHLLRVHAKGKRVVLVVDEAQNFTPDLLEQVRLLTNLETDTRKLLQIILIGQPELRDLLERDDLRQLAQRITGRYHLEPMSRAETESYVQHRLRVAGATTEPFTAQALRELYRVSSGVPRLINIIADRALLGGYTQDSHEISAPMVRRAASEVFGRRLLPRWIPWTLGATAAAMVVVVAWLVLQATVLPGLWRPGGKASPPPVAAAQAPLPPAPPTLVELLGKVAPTEHRDAEWQQLFLLWKAPFSSGGEDACDQAVRAGLECLGGGGSLELLRLLNRPVMIDLAGGESRHPALLTQLTDGEATLWFAGRAHTVPLEQFATAWQGNFVLLWKPPVPGTHTLKIGMRGTAVRELRERLDRWAGRKPMRGDDFFDVTLQQRVRELQLKLGVKDDGTAGPQTQIMLDAAIALPGTPLLLPRKPGAP